MTHPNEEHSQMKALKTHNDMVGFVVDAECGIPTRCLCGGGGGESSTRCLGIQCIKPTSILFLGENTSHA
ncbi:hypothetical protein Bca101_031591 [Brassica carinata]